MEIYLLSILYLRGYCCNDENSVIFILFCIDNNIHDRNISIMVIYYFVVDTLTSVSVFSITPIIGTTTRNHAK